MIYSCIYLWQILLNNKRGRSWKVDLELLDILELLFEVKLLEWDSNVDLGWSVSHVYALY